MAYLRDSVAPKRMGNATKRNQIAIIVSDVRIAEEALLLEKPKPVQSSVKVSEPWWSSKSRS